MFKIMDQQPVVDKPAPKEDTRNLVKKMFFNHDKVTGELVPLPVLRASKIGPEGIKSFNDCILFIKDYGTDEEDYKGELKGKNVVVIGGRRAGRSGTGVELILATESIEEFCSLLKEVANTIGGA